MQIRAHGRKLRSLRRLKLGWPHKALKHLPNPTEGLDEWPALGVIETIRVRLREIGLARYSERRDGIEVYPADDSGFTVGLFLSPRGYTVYFDGWHEEFVSEDEALDCFEFGLSPACRLCVVLRGTTATKWTVESMRDGEWTPDSVTGLIFQPFWRTARVVYRQNRLIAG